MANDDGLRKKLSALLDNGGYIEVGEFYDVCKEFPDFVGHDDFLRNSVKPAFLYDKARGLLISAQWLSAGKSRLLSLPKGGFYGPAGVFGHMLSGGFARCETRLILDMLQEQGQANSKNNVIFMPARLPEDRPEGLPAINTCCSCALRYRYRFARPKVFRILQTQLYGEEFDTQFWRNGAAWQRDGRTVNAVLENRDISFYVEGPAGKSKQEIRHMMEDIHASAGISPGTYKLINHKTKEHTMNITGDGNTVIIQGAQSTANIDQSKKKPPELPRAITEEKFEELQDFLSGFLSQPAAIPADFPPETALELETVVLEDSRPTGWARFKNILKKGTETAVAAIHTLAAYANENPNVAQWIREILAKRISNA